MTMDTYRCCRHCTFAHHQPYQRRAGRIQPERDNHAWPCTFCAAHEDGWQIVDLNGRLPMVVFA